MNTTLQGKTEFSSSLRQTYNWFYTVFNEAVKVSCLEFFGIDTDLKLFSVSENDNIFFKGDEYFVTRIKIKKNLDAVLRLSQSAVKNLLDEALGRGDKPFKVEELSELEAKILTTFNEFLFNNFKKNLVPAEKIDKNEMPKSLCHLVFYLDYKKRDFGKLVITLPTNILEPQFVQPDGEKFTMGDFKTCKVDMKIKVGSSKLTLGEVKSINVEDILLLENSDIYTMTLCNDAGEELSFKISPDPSIILNNDDNEGENMAENAVSANNMWDSIQVDISAEFEKVKISLGELKQISEGLVVDIGSIYENRIDLKVENKIVARGELVILNDRYGVRIDEVVEPAPEQEPAPAVSEVSEVYPPESEAINEQEFEDDDFNYDEFDENSDI